jgi:hypothetical protein
MKARTALAAISWAALGILHMPLAHSAPKTSCFEYEDACYRDAYTACQAVARKRHEDRFVDNPYDRVLGAKDAGEKFWCKLGDKDGNENEQEYGSKREGAPTPLSTAAPAAPDEAKPDDCKLDKLKGAALRSQVVSLVRKYTEESNRKLIDDPKGSAESVPSVGRGFFTGDYGTLLENLVAQRVSADACLSKYVAHLTAAQQSKAGPNGEKGDHPDFRGIGKGLEDLQIDITTADAKAKKLASEGGKSNYVYIEYERGLCQDPQTKMAVKIPAGVNRAKIKNGVCP